jgi:hypothetical protein
VNSNHQYTHRNLKVVNDKEKASYDTLDNSMEFKEGDPERSKTGKLQIS